MDEDAVRASKRAENTAVMVHGEQLECVECGAVSRRCRGWRAYVTDDEPPHVVVYCQWCALAEFDR